MSNKERILEHLDAFSRVKPCAVIARLSRGSKLMKSMGQEYEIDDANADERLGHFPVGAIPYGAIHRALKSDGSEIRVLFNGAACLPFSKVIRAGFGQCLEKAALVQLAAQRAESSYLISGALELDGELGAEFHAFNLVARGDNVYLADAENPFSLDKEGRVARPYVVPVTGISQNGTIVVPNEYRAGRTYCLD